MDVNPWLKATAGPVAGVAAFGVANVATTRYIVPSIKQANVIGKVEDSRSITEIAKIDTFDFVNEGSIEGSIEEGLCSEYVAPKITVNKRGELTNGSFTLDSEGMIKHTDGTLGKSNFLYNVDANKAVLDAAAYADKYNLGGSSTGNPLDFPNKAKVYVENGPVGVTGNGELKNYINIYRTKTGYVHGCPGNP